jgi:hypothetical protein
MEFQKLMKNVFFTLYEHSTHSQQLKLSKVSHALPAVRSHAHCRAAGPVYKMASQQQKAFCVPRFEVSKSVIAVQREFHAACVRWPGREADNLLPNSAEFKRNWVYTSVPPYCFME